MKKVISMIVVICLITGLFSLCAYAEENITVFVNGKKVDFSQGGQEPVIENGRTLVPVRAVFEALGATVSWDDELKVVSCRKNDTNVSLVIDYDRMLVNGYGIKLDAPPRILNNNTMIPVRAVAEAFECDVNWDNNTRTVSIIGGFGREINVCLGSEPDTLDPALNVSLDGATMIVHLFSGLAKWDKDGVSIVPDCAEKLPESVKNADGTVNYTYTIRDDACWSDGVKLTAHDFEYAWKRAVSDELYADYSYMFENIKGYYQGDLAVKALDDKTLSVTLESDVPYWNELLAFPTYMPVRKDVVSNDIWWCEPSTLVCNGPYKITQWKHGGKIVLEKNQYYHDKDSVIMKKINFILSDNDKKVLEEFRSGKLHMADNVPVDKIESLKGNEEFYTISQLGTYYLCWNVNCDLLSSSSTLEGAEKEKACAEIRKAFSLLLDRNYITEALTKAGEVPASSLVPIGITDVDGSEFKKDYFNVNSVNENIEEAEKILKKYYSYDKEKQKFTNAPLLSYIYNTSSTHQAVGEYVQAMLAMTGVRMEIENCEWNTFLNKRRNGDFFVARHGWVADYNDPITFLDMWTTDCYNNDAQLGRGEHKNVKAYSMDLTPYGYDVVVENGTWAETYDFLISIIKNCEESGTRYALMHMAEDMLMSTGCITPIYYYTDVYLLDENVKDMFTSPLGYKYFMYSYVEE